MNAYFDAIQRYATFSGRTSRSGFWLFGVVQVGLVVLAYALDRAFGTATEDESILAGLVVLFHIIPQITVMVRRLHDVDQSGWWILASLTGIGNLVLLVFACIRGTHGPNRYGPDPLSDTHHFALAPGDDFGRAVGQSGRPDPSFAAPPQRDLVDELERLAGLKASGALSEAEFEVMKARALAQAR